MVEFRIEYYAGRPKVIGPEREEVEKSKQSFAWDILAQSIDTLTAALSAIPQFGAIAGPMGGATTDFGGQHLAQVGRAAASGLSIVSSVLKHESYLSGVAGTRQRRYNDWQFQANLGRREMRQVDQQLAAAQLKIDIAEAE